jgi:hypothetical protein
VSTITLTDAGITREYSWISDLVHAIELDLRLFLQEWLPREYDSVSLGENFHNALARAPDGPDIRRAIDFLYFQDYVDILRKLDRSNLIPVELAECLRQRGRS